MARSQSLIQYCHFSSKFSFVQCLFTFEVLRRIHDYVCGMLFILFLPWQRQTPWRFCQSQMPWRFCQRFVPLYCPPSFILQIKQQVLVCVLDSWRSIMLFYYFKDLYNLALGTIASTIYHIRLSMALASHKIYTVIQHNLDSSFGD